MLRTLVMAVDPEKKERIVNGDLYNSTKDLPTVKLVFSLEHKEGKNNEWWDLPWVNRTCSFYRELEVSLLVWIHHNHGWYGWLIEEMGNVEWITGNSFHVLVVVHHGLIPWSFMRSFLVEFIKYLLVVHALVLVLDNYHEIEWPCYWWTSISHTWCYCWASPLRLSNAIIIDVVWLFGRPLWTCWSLIDPHQLSLSIRVN